MPMMLSRTAQPRACAGVCLVFITRASGSLEVHVFTLCDSLAGTSSNFLPTATETSSPFDDFVSFLDFKLLCIDMC
jgi:hypothetical protein